MTTTRGTAVTGALHPWHDFELEDDRGSWSLNAAEFLGTAQLLVSDLSAVVVVSPASPGAALRLPGWLARGIAGAFFRLTGTLVTLSGLGRYSGGTDAPDRGGQGIHSSRGSHPGCANGKGGNQ